MSGNISIDPASTRAAKAFLERLAGRYSVSGALVYGSRARQVNRANSDLDLAVLLSGTQQPRVDVVLDMAAISFDVFMETDVLVYALPLCRRGCDQRQPGGLSLMARTMRNPNRRPTHPGEILREDVLPALDLTQEARVVEGAGNTAEVRAGGQPTLN